MAWAPRNGAVFRRWRTRIAAQIDDRRAVARSCCAQGCYLANLLCLAQQREAVHGLSSDVSVATASDLSLPWYVSASVVQSAAGVDGVTPNAFPDQFVPSSPVDVST